jgi:hypothetical protein
MIHDALTRFQGLTVGFDTSRSGSVPLTRQLLTATLERFCQDRVAWTRAGGLQETWGVATGLESIATAISTVATHARSPW